MQKLSAFIIVAFSLLFTSQAYGKGSKIETLLGSEVDQGIQVEHLLPTFVTPEKWRAEYSSTLDVTGERFAPVGEFMLPEGAYEDEKAVFYNPDNGDSRQFKKMLGRVEYDLGTAGVGTQLGCRVRNMDLATNCDASVFTSFRDRDKSSLELHVGGDGDYVGINYAIRE